MKKILIAAAALAIAATGSLNFKVGDLRYGLDGMTLRHWNWVPEVSMVPQPACAFDDTGGGPCATGVATSYTLSGPTNGSLGTASNAFTVKGVGNVSPSVTITPNDSSHGGTFNPSTVTLSGNTAQTFTYTPAQTGTYNIATANSGTLTNPAAISFTAAGTPAVSLDSQEVNHVGQHSTSSPLTWSFDNAAGDLLIVGVNCTNAGATAPTINSVTYNGTAMSLVPGGSVTTAVGNASILNLYYLKSPATGSNIVSVNFATGANALDCIAGGISFSGTASNPVGTAATATGAGTSGSVTLSGTTKGDYVVSFINNGSSVNSVNSPSTMSWLLNVTQNTSGDNAGMAQVKSSGGSVTPTFNMGNDDWAIAAVEIF